MVSRVLIPGAQWGQKPRRFQRHPSRWLRNARRRVCAAVEKLCRVPSSPTSPAGTTSAWSPRTTAVRRGDPGTEFVVSVPDDQTL